MLDRSGNVGLMTSILAGVFLGAIAAPSSALAQGTPGMVLKADQIAPAKLNALPENAVIDIKGKRMTAGEVRTRMRQGDKIKEEKLAALQTKTSDFEAKRAKFLQEQEAKLQADNAKAMAELARLRQAGGQAQPSEREAIQREAAQLYQRSKTASPAEKAQIEKRAGELLRQLGR